MKHNDPIIIASNIHSCLTAMKESDLQWKENAIRLCEQVAAAKALYPQTKEFGAWWDAQGFDMNIQTRAALVAMGKEIDRAREAIAVTKSRSIEQIYLNDFRVSDVRKSEKPKDKAEPKTKTAKAKRASPPEEEDEPVVKSNVVRVVTRKVWGRSYPTVTKQVEFNNGLDKTVNGKAYRTQAERNTKQIIALRKINVDVEDIERVAADLLNIATEFEGDPMIMWAALDLANTAYFRTIKAELTKTTKEKNKGQTETFALNFNGAAINE